MRATFTNRSRQMRKAARGLAGSCGGRDQDILAGPNRFPTLVLGLGRRPELAFEPFLDERVEAIGQHRSSFYPNGHTMNPNVCFGDRFEIRAAHAPP